MIESWEKDYKAGSNIEIPVHAINDLYQDWSGDIKLVLYKGDEELSMQSQKITIKSLGKETRKFMVKIPEKAGLYHLKASITLNEEEVFSLRDILVK